MYKIITHPGSAHKDDFLSTCVLLAALGEANVYRREPTSEELDDPDTYVVDIGMQYDADRHNFDHHQDGDLPCGFHLVMQHLGYHEAASQVYLWYQYMNMIDVRGAHQTAEHLGIDSDILFTTSSPIEGFVLAQFAGVQELMPGDFLYRLMKELGEDKLELIDRKMQRLQRLQSEARLMPVGNCKAVVSEIADDPKLSLELYLRQLADPRVVMTITPSTRGPGWELIRVRKTATVDFRLIEKAEGIRFVHHRGFLAKTEAGLAIDKVVRLAEHSLIKSCYVI